MWFRFEWPLPFREAAARNGGRIAIHPSRSDLSAVFTVGCGVTGYDEGDCLALVRAQLFAGRPLPEFRDRVPDIDVSTLPTPVQQHLGNPASRGVWFPDLNLDTPRR
jgi:hypothetical protein